ncbi:MAG TPA: flavodoxin family protein [Magnetospirillaceae bacterium]|nr:flavodoxin family protein [Magnetospirillaceae bacterium]
MTGTLASGNRKPRALVIVHSYHHGNTKKVAESMARALEAEIRTQNQVKPALLEEYDLLGFGAGIDSGRHYRPILDLADRLPPGAGRQAFIFSTCGIPAAFARGQEFERQVEANHAALRSRLRDRGYEIAGEFSCVGFNTNSFLRFFGGLNKGRPDAGDLRRAEEFALSLTREV